MKTLYLDCISGIAGDMTLAALVDLGADPQYIADQLRTMPIDPFTMEFVEVDRRGITSKYLKLDIEGGDHGHHHHHDDHEHGHSHEHHHHDDHEHGHSHDHHHHDDHEHGHGHDHHHHDDHEHGHSHEHHRHDDHEHGHGHDHHHHDDHEHGHSHEHHRHDDHEHGHGHDHHHHHHHNDDEHGHSHEHHHHDDHEHGHSHDHHHHDDHEHGHGHDHHHRKAADILAMIEASSLPQRAKERSTAIFEHIAVAEGKIHGMDPSEVHFHEVGAMDSIIDVIGVCLALESLDIDRIIVSPVPTGTGRMRMAHGLYPIPAPATAELLRGIPLSSFTAQGELTTPTGAGIVKALATGFGTMPAGTIDRIGYGAGTKNFAHPNVVRAVLLTEQVYMNKASEQLKLHEEYAEPATPLNDLGQSFGRTVFKPLSEMQETIVILEAQVDDASGETLGYTMDRLFAQGALDVYYTSVHMKKNRPGTLITVLCHEPQKEDCEQVLLEETSTIGVRHSFWKRKALRRQWQEVYTEYGYIKVKQAFDGDKLIRQAPEYEDAAAAARKYQVPLELVYQAVYKQL